MHALLSFFLSSALLGQAMTTTQKHKPDFGKVRTYIQKQMTTQSVPSIAVAVAHGEGRVGRFRDEEENPDL
jgi:hypothetical protein